MMANDYGDDLDALTSLLEENDNPYDDSEPFSVKSSCTQRVSQAVKKRQGTSLSQSSSQSQSSDAASQSCQESADEDKSKMELIEELRQMREQLSQVQGGNSVALQSSSQLKTSPPKETFSCALFPDPTPKQAQKKKTGSPKLQAHLEKPDRNDQDDVDDEGDVDDGLSDLFEDDKDIKRDTTKLTPQKAEHLFKKNTKRLAYTPKTDVAAPKKVSPYKCALCDKTFEDRKAMAVHEFKHKVIRSCECNICGKSFTDKLQLQTHLRTHSSGSADGETRGGAKSGTPGGSRNRSGGSSGGAQGSSSSSSSSLGSGGNAAPSSTKRVPQIGAGGAKGKPPAEEPKCETEYYSKIRIINPLVSSATMQERMRERKMIRMSILKHYSRTVDMEGDWVTMGVVIKKLLKTDQKGKPYSMWIMNDLSDLDETVALFLFGKVHEEHWKTAEGSVIGILNATFIDRKEDTSYKDSDGVRLKVDHPQKLLLLGKSRDFGRCKATKKDGQPCSKIVNTSDCQYCEYHVHTEFKKMGSKRTDLSSSYSGVTPKTYMKKLKKDNFIYGGKSVSMPSMSIAGGGVKSQSKMTSHFKTSQLSLKGLGVKGAEALVEEARDSVLTLHGRGQQEKDMMVEVAGASREFSDLLKAPSVGSQNIMRHMVTVENSKKTVSAISAKDLLKQHQQEMAAKRASRPPALGHSSQSSQSPRSTPGASASGQRLLAESTKQNARAALPEDQFAPRLGKDWSGGGDINLDDTSPPKIIAGAASGKGRAPTLQASRQRALALIRQKGPIKREDPNAVRKTIDERKKEAIKRKVEQNWKKEESPADSDGGVQSRPAKKRKTFLGQDVDLSKDEMDKILKAKSSHAGLLAEHEAELMERYFKEMEKKEGLENKLDSVRELKRKVVSCKECAFTWFVPSDICKQEKHTLRWHEATQRFFRCRDCCSRAIAFDRLPKKACRSCGSFNYERTSMLKDRDGPKVGGETLKLRGDEEKWLT